jgi:hypothetical protein
MGQNPIAVGNAHRLVMGFVHRALNTATPNDSCEGMATPNGFNHQLIFILTIHLA